jgi:hypothetical protein
MLLEVDPDRLPVAAGWFSSVAASVGDTRGCVAGAVAGAVAGCGHGDVATAVDQLGVALLDVLGGASDCLDLLARALMATAREYAAVDAAQIPAPTGMSR